MSFKQSFVFIWLCEKLVADNWFSAIILSYGINMTSSLPKGNFLKQLRYYLVSITLPFSCLGNFQKIKFFIMAKQNFASTKWLMPNPSAGSINLKLSKIVKKCLLHFVAFFHVASLLSKGVDNEKVGVDNKKALELTNSTFSIRVDNEEALELDNSIFFCILAWFQYRNIIQKCNKISWCIVAWSRQTFWFKLNFLLPKNE